MENQVTIDRQGHLLLIGLNRPRKKMLLILIFYAVFLLLIPNYPRMIPFDAA